MAVGITLGMRIRTTLGNERAYRMNDIPPYRRISILIDGEPRRGMRAEKKTHPALHLGFRHQRADFAGYINEFATAMCVQAYFFHAFLVFDL